MIIYRVIATREINGEVETFNTQYTDHQEALDDFYTFEEEGWEVSYEEIIK